MFVELGSGLSDRSESELIHESAQFGDGGFVAQPAHDVTVERQHGCCGNVRIKVTGMEIGHIVAACRIHFSDQRKWKDAEESAAGIYPLQAKSAGTIEGHLKDLVAVIRPYEGVLRAEGCAQLPARHH